MRRDFHENHLHGGENGSRERALVELVARQHGVVAWRQLREVGFTRRMIERRLESGRLYRPQPQVYSLLPRLTAAGRMMAAVLSCGPGAALSHRAAAAVWDLGPWPTGRIDVSVTRNRGPRSGVRIHRVRALEVVERDGFPVTTAMRTLAGLAAAVSRPTVERAYEQADRIGLLDVTELARECEGRRGSCVLKRLIGEGREAPPSKNELERGFLDLCRGHGIPLPSLNVILHGIEVDAYWEPDLVVELDGYATHGTRRAFEEDRRRDAMLAARGIRVLRFSWRQVTAESERVAEAIASASTAPSRGSSAGGSSPPRPVPAISSSGAFSFGMKPDFMPK
jgi:Protein of unknown function (DUF559)/Transcriptional regulator, AbiEi antitoxin